MLFLATVAAWLLHPFATSRQIGAGDALWYANMLADFVLQWRAGIFPVFAGQTEFAFNGAVYPLRVAPLYQHLAGVLDLLTGQRLDFFTLQHLCVVVAGAAGIFTCYFTLVSLVPERRWTAAALAALYLSCPGLLGTVYTQDLYMTWMTVPFVPLAFYGAVRAFQRDDFTAQIWLAAGLAALWMAHSPVALWTTLLVGLIQLVRLVGVHQTLGAWKRALLGGTLFAALAHYPFVSVAALNAPGAASTVTGGLEQAERISNVVREVFPAVLLPLSNHAGALSDLQLGYGWWLIFFITLAAARRGGGAWEMRALLACAVLLLCLLLPVPGNEWLWAHLPAQIKRITFYWPMHRFYILLAALLAIAGQLALAAWFARGAAFDRAVRLILFAVCSWSLWESRQFIAAGRDRTSPAEVSAMRLRPENLLLMNHAYGLFPALPAYFSNGTMDPRTEARLLDRESMRPVPEVARPRKFVPMRGSIDENPGVLKLEPTVYLEPGKRYELTFQFQQKTYSGILQLSGSSFFREYVLPASGQRLAFGSAPGHSHTLSLWTTASEGTAVTLRFIPTLPSESPSGYVDFAEYFFGEIFAGDETVSTTSILPYRAEIKTPRSTLLETPRMFQPGYTAVVNGLPQPVASSPNGLVMVPLEAGASQVALKFRGPAALRIAYFTTLAAWLGTAVLVIAIVARRSGRDVRETSPQPS